MLFHFWFIQKSFRGRESVACAGYATEVPATTATTEDPEALEVPEGPVKVILPGRKHVYEPGYLDVSAYE